MTQNIHSTRIYTSLLLIIMTGLITSCGASKTNHSSTSSRGLDPVDYGNNYLLGECNRIELSQMNITGQVGTYYDPATKQYRTDYINLNLKSVPAELYTSSTLQFQFYRWSERVIGQKQINTIPVRFYFVDKLTGNKYPSNGVDRISKSTMAAARTYFGKSWINVGTNQFFERTMILLTGIEMQYDAVTIAKYDTGQGTSNAIAQGDVLLPAFYSNPNVYKSKNPLPDLYNLHPNIALLGSNSSENDYYRITEDICHELSGIGTRIPASADTEPHSVIGEIWGRIVDSLEIIFSK